LLNKDPGAQDRALVSPHRGVIDILLHVVGMLEYWSTGILGLNSELGLNCDYQNTHVSYEVGGDRNPSLHHSIIPLFLLPSLLA
jgi:hypothetical protein